MSCWVSCPPKLALVEGSGDSAEYCGKGENPAWSSKFACFIKVRTSDVPNQQRRQVNLLYIEQISRS